MGVSRICRFCIHCSRHQVCTEGAQIFLRRRVPGAPEVESVVKVLSWVLFASQSSVRSRPQRVSELHLQGIRSDGREGARLLTIDLRKGKQAWKCTLSKARHHSYCSNSLTLATCHHSSHCAQFTSLSWPILLFPV